MLRGLCNQGRRLSFCTERALTYRCLQPEPTIGINANRNQWHQSTAASGLCTPPTLWLYNVFHSHSIIDHSTPKSSYFVDPFNVFALGKSARTYSSSSNLKESRTKSEEESSPKDESTPTENHEKMVGSVADADEPPVARELRQAQEDMMVNMRRCSYVLFAVGATHIVWGGAMFLALETLETPLDHAVLTEVCISSTVFCGLAYQMRQAVKPIQLFANVQDYGHMGTIFLSGQITRMVGAFFHRGRGIAFVLSLTIGAHLLSCITFLL